MHDTAIKILSAAKPLFNRHGLRKTTIDDIAREAGIGKGTVYNYFKDKEAIYLAAKREEIQCFMKKLRAAIRQESKGSRQMISFITCWYQQHEEYRSQYPFTPDFFVEIEEVAECIAVMNGFHHDKAMLIQGIIETGIEQGEFKVANIETACWSVLTCLGGLSMSHLLQAHYLAPYQKAEIMAGLLVAAFSAGETQVLTAGPERLLAVTN